MIAAVFAFALAHQPRSGDASKVRILRDPVGFHLTVNSSPFFIKGAGGSADKRRLRDLGGNSWRTWGADNLDAELDEAQRLGMKVTVGIWLGHKDQGFKYDDPAMVANQLEMATGVFRKYKDHPAVLMWGIGNEMEGSGNDPLVWKAVEDIAKAAKQIDPNHPTMTVVAEIGGDKVPNLNHYCPDIDILGINSYGGAPSVFDRYRKAGGIKPYVVTEFGPLGQWEVGKSPWGAPYESTSTEKAAHYRESYEKAVLAAKGVCLGSYAFTWGAKQEETPTWFGMLLTNGDRVAATDVMGELWSGKAPEHPCPVISMLHPDGQTDVAAGESVHVSLRCSSPSGDPIKVRWILRGQQAVHGTGGSREPELTEFPGALTAGDATGATVRLPSAGGYRLFVYVTDEYGGAATGNVPLHAR